MPVREPQVTGRPRVPDRQALTGILFVLKTGIPWEDLPQEMGCGSGMTCWRRLQEWNEAGVWQRLHQVLLGRVAGCWRDRLVPRGRGQLARASKRGGEQTGPSPVDRSRLGSKHHVIVEAKASRWRSR